MRIKMLCNECGKRFSASIGQHTVEVECPECGGCDTEPAEVF